MFRGRRRRIGRIANAVLFGLLARLAERALARACCLALPACEASGANSSSLGLRCPVVGHESQSLRLLFMLRQCAVAVRRWYRHVGHPRQLAQTTGPVRRANPFAVLLLLVFHVRIPAPAALLVTVVSHRRPSWRRDANSKSLYM